MSPVSSSKYFVISLHQVFTFSRLTREPKKVISLQELEKSENEFKVNHNTG